MERQIRNLNEMFKFGNNNTFNLLNSKFIILVDEWIKPSKQQEHVFDTENMFTLQNLTSSNNNNIPRGGWCV